MTNAKHSGPNEFSLHVTGLRIHPRHLPLRFLDRFTSDGSTKASAITRTVGWRSSAMAQFRPKKLDLGGFINIKIIRDHGKRKAYEQFEPQR
jgi:hypothetical protein